MNYRAALCSAHSFLLNTLPDADNSLSFLKAGEEKRYYMIWRDLAKSCISVRRIFEAGALGTFFQQWLFTSSCLFNTYPGLFTESKILYLVNNFRIKGNGKSLNLSLQQ